MKEKTEIEIRHVYLRSIPGPPIPGLGNPHTIQNYLAIKAISFKDSCLYVLCPPISAVQVIATVNTEEGSRCTLYVEIVGKAIHLVSAESFCLEN